MPRKKDTLVKTGTPKSVAPRLAALPTSYVRRWLLQGLSLTVVVAGLLAGLIHLGRWGLEQIRGQDRYAASFSDINCNPPPGLERSAFLDEVQYLARLPNRFSILDEDLAPKLAAAFAKHPWVEKVDGVMVRSPRQVQVRLTLRRPVLAVRTTDGLIAVDRHGVRLPKSAATADLPVFDDAAGPPQGPAGTKWGDPKVEQHAQNSAPFSRDAQRSAPHPAHAP